MIEITDMGPADKAAQEGPPLGAPAYVVLGMVRLGARSGYEIKQMVELPIRFFWTISQVQIYPSLERLESAGLVKGRSEPQGKRPKRVYEITPRGEVESAADVAGTDGNVYPTLTLRMGMIDVCREFEEEMLE
jgi:hypothetical protein